MGVVEDFEISAQNAVGLRFLEIFIDNLETINEDLNHSVTPRFPQRQFLHRTFLNSTMKNISLGSEGTEWTKYRHLIGSLHYRRSFHFLPLKQRSK